MHPFRVVRRLLSRAHEDWQDAVEGLFSQPRRLMGAGRPVGPRPLRVMRLERRRVLSADFSLTATGLVLSGFDDAGGDTLTVQQEGDAYQFTSANGWEQHEPGEIPEGVTIDGDTLSVDRGVLEGLEDGLTIQGSLGHQLDVRLGDADFSSLSGPVTLAGATAVGQDQPFALFTAPTEGFQLIVAPGGTVLSSLNVSGDLNIVSVGGSITDSPGSEITISGNATFTSRAASPAGDFNGDGLVDQTDYTEHWAKNYGLTSGATKYHGDANGDGRVDAADYTLWRDTIGQTGRGGIELANEAGDRLVIGGVATFDAAEPEGTHDIYVGVGGHAEFGSVNAYGANVIIHEDATAGDSGPTTVLGNIQAYTLVIQSGGQITDAANAQIIVNGDASFTVTEAAVIADGSLVQAIVLANGTGDNRVEVGSIATFIVEHPTTVVPGFNGPKGIDVGVAASGSAANAFFNTGSLRFYAPGGTVRIAEDSGTVLAGWDTVEGPVAAITAGPTASVAHTLQLQSVGGISDEADAVVLVTGVAADGSLVYDPTASAAFYANLPIVLANEGASNVLSVDGLATFIGNPNSGGVDVGVTSAGVAAAATFNTGTLRFTSNSGTIRIAEDSSTVLVGWITTPAPQVFPVGASTSGARAVEITSAGSITDEADFNINIGGNATFVAKDEIVLADSVAANSRLSVFGVATFISTDGEDISVGVNAAGTSTTTAFTAGSIRFVSVGGDVKIAEDDPMELADWAPLSIAPSVPLPTPTSSVARNLELVASASITDATNASVNVTGNATLIARNIILADTTSVGTSNALTVGGVATFLSTGNSATLQVGTTTSGAPTPALFQAGSLRFYLTNGLVRIAEDDSMLLADWMTVPSSPLFVTPWITTPRMASEARTIELLSAASISDTENATLLATTRNLVTGVRFYSPDSSATFVAAGSITLADGGADNKLMVDGVATFVSTAASGQRIDVGVTPTGGMADAEFIAGSVRFWAPDGTVRLVEDAAVNLKGATYSETPGTVIGSWPGAASRIIPNTVVSNRTGSLEIVSHGPITDASTTVVEVTGDAGFRVVGTAFEAPNSKSIVLADGAAGNSLVVGGAATFIVDGSLGVDVGVTNAGGVASAEFNADSLRFDANLAVRIAEDSATHLDTWNSLTVGLIRPVASIDNSHAGTLDLFSAGSITDTDNAYVSVSGAATFVAAQNITLADGGDDNLLIVNGMATFVVGASQTLSVGIAATGAVAPAYFRAQSLRFAAPNGVARIAESNATILAAWPMGSTSPLLGAAPPMATEAKTIEVYSTEGITDVPDAVVLVTGRDSGGARVYDPTASATFVAQRSITLADGSVNNKLIVDGLVTLVSSGSPQRIDVGVTNTGEMAAAEFIAGSVRFSASGMSVRLVEDASATFKEVVYAETSGTVLAGWGAGTTSPLVPVSVNRSWALSLDIVSNGPITDVANAVVEVAGPAGFRVIGAAIPNDGTVSIRLADAGGDNRLIVGGAATFVVDGPRGTDVGVTPTGTPAAAEFTAGSLRFASLGAVRIAEDNATQLAGWGDLPVGLIRQAGISFSQAQTLELLSTGAITDASGAQLRVVDDATFIATGGDGAWAIDLADSPADNQLSISDLATFIVTGENAGIRVGVTAGGTPADAGFTAGRLRFSAPTGDVQIAEDASTIIGGVVNDAAKGTLLAGWTSDAVSPLLVTPAPTMSQAKSLQLVSAGPITDAADAIIDVTFDAGLLVTEAAAISANNLAIDLADSTSPSTINRLTVGGFATFITLGGGGIEIGDTPRSGPAEATFNAGAIRFYAPNSQVRIAEDSGTSLAKSTTEGVLGLGGPLPASVAGSLQLTSNGVISDESTAQVEVAGNAVFIVSSIANVGDDRAIVLANSGGDNRLTVGGLAFFQVIQQPSDLAPKGIDVGVAADGTPAGAVFTAGRLAFDAAGGVVRIAEDDGTVVAGVSSQAGDLQLLSAGAILDEAVAKLQVTGNATFVSALGTTLADDFADNQLSVGGLATFVVGANQTLAVGTPATGPAAAAAFNAGSLRFFAPNGTARIAEDSATELLDWMTVAPSPLIAAPPMAIEAKTIEIFSAGSITDTPTAVIIATGNSGGVRVYDPTATATFVATNSITLADSGADNKLIVDGMLTLVSTTGAGQQINVGVTGAGAAAAAEFVAGSVRFSASGGDVKIAEDASAAFKGVTYSETPGTHIAGWTPGTISALIVAPPDRSAGASLEVTSAGAITDAADAKVLIAGDAKFTVSTIANVAGPAAITLADGDAANELVIGAHANFVVNQVPAGSAKGIDAGVVTATGVPAAALFTAGTLGFSAQGGMVRLAEDNDTVLGGFSTAQDLELLSAGIVTDTTSVTTDDGVAATSVTLTQSAKLKAGVNGENDVTLGAGAAAFSMGAPQLFNDAQYLAVQAENVSIHADSGVNVRTGDAPLSNLDNYSQFAGTFYLAATGHVSQVTTAAPKALTADKISVASDNGAVLLRLVELTSTGTDPNLQIKSGGSVALSQPLVGGGTVGDKFAGSSIPSPTSPAFAPVIVEADDPLTGERPAMPARPGNPGFEDVLLAGGENSRLSEAVRLPNGDYVVDHLLQDGGQTRTIDDLYSMVVIVTGDANVGDVYDPNTDARRDVDTAESRGVAIENGGNAFLSTLAGGDLFFTNRNREGGDQLDGIAVQMAGGVFTAIAAGTLRIDTEDPDNLAANLRTTRLVSKTGTVTNVNSDSATEFGPRAILDPSTEEGNAATSGLVRADQNFEQRITMAIGSRGEDNLLVEVEWADTADIRQFSNANVRLPADPNAPTNTVGSTSVPGSRPYADVVQTPVGAIEANVADQSVTGYQYQTLSGASRVATITHNYDDAFVPNNPAQNRLPTTVRVFNDAAINLFDQGGARNLNSVSFSIAPRIITLPPSGFFIISTPELPQRYEPAAVTLPRTEPTQVTQQTTSDDGRAVTVSSAEDVLYGRVDEKGEWIVDIPGESWPQVMEDAEGDFLREIRDKIDEGPYSKGRYVIKVVTPRSEQLLEEWVKGDDAEADGEAAAKPEATKPEAVKPAEDAALPFEDAQPAAPVIDGPMESPAAVAPQGAPLGLMEMESAPTDARQVAFAAMAAVGVWRRRLNEAGPFTLDADGVAFTRVKRQRRRRSGE